jgi:hypothetical protein
MLTKEKLRVLEEWKEGTVHVNGSQQIIASGEA